MKTFLDALPDVATSATAYGAYVLTLGAWILIAWRVRRHAILLAHIRLLPAKDRLLAIKAEMGVVEIPRGITADQWLKSRIHTFYMIGVALAFVTVFAIITLTVLAGAGKVTGAIGLGE